MMSGQDRGIQTLADLTGFVIDRTLTPEKVIGQAWVISKSRVVVLASRVSNYAEAPWALMVRFPHPDLNFCVKALNFHPDFNKRAARDYYLAQALELSPQPGIFESDICTLTLDPEVTEMAPDKVLELNRALSLPLQINSQDLSGVMRAGETGNVLQKALTSGRNGVLSFFDDRKIPFARLSIKAGRVQRAVYLGLTNEFAICELMWRKPGGNFVMQSQDDFNWPNIPEIGSPTDQLAAEAIRRAQELPRLIDGLGGPNAAFARATNECNFSQIPEQTRWIAERLFPSLDGYLQLAKLSDRIQVDSYSAIMALNYLKSLNAVRPVPGGQFHRNGQLAPPLTPASDLDLAVWDQLQGFYLDEYSGAPVTAAGAYFGAASMLNPRTLIHTISFPQATHGAAVLKDGRLVGIFNGRYMAPNPQNNPPFPLSQMIWVGALADTGAKRIRAAETTLEEVEALDPIGRGTMTGLAAARKAAAVLQPHQDELEPSQIQPSTEPEFLQKFSKVQILAAGGGMFLIGLLMALNGLLAPKPAAAPAVTQTATTTSAQSTNPVLPPSMAKDLAAAVKVATQYASFKDKTFPPFNYTNTAEIAGGKLTFGLEEPNLKILFVVWPQPANENLMKSMWKSKVPFLDWQADEELPLAHGEDKDTEIWWHGGNYTYKDKEKDEWVKSQLMTGVFPSTQPGQSIMFFAYPSAKKGPVDFNGTFSIIQRMRVKQAEGAAGTDGQPAATEEATPEQIELYRSTIGDLLKGSFKLPEEGDEKTKCSVLFGIGETGNMTKLELKDSSGVEQVDKAMQKLVTSHVPFPPPPKTKGSIMILLKLAGGELKVEEP